jgi:uncharacterized membrane protein
MLGPMRRKIVFIISALLVFFDIGFTVAVYDTGERQLAATLAAIATVVNDYLRPIPRLGG